MQSSELYTTAGALLRSGEGFHQWFGQPDAALSFVVLHDYAISVTSPRQPKIMTQNLVTSFKQISAAQARLQRQSGIQDFDELSRSLHDKIPNSGGIAFRYLNEPISSIHRILSQAELDNHTNRLLDFLGRGEVAPEHEILVGHGYGGLICEQAFMRLQTDSTSPTRARAKRRLRGMLLFNTPHFQAGLAQWTMLTAKELNLTTARSRRNQDWSGCLKDFIKISKMQAKFADIFEKSESQVRLVCCFAKQRDPVTKLLLSPEFCCLPAVEAIEIHGSSHFCINTAKEDLRYIIERLAIWAKEIREDKKPIHATLPLSLAGSSRSNDPAWQWDPKSANRYFILSWKGKSNLPAVSVGLGDIVKETSSLSSTNRPIATRDDVEPSQDKALVDFGLSHVIKNDFTHWEYLLNADIERAGYKVVVREEWSKARTVKYVKAALQLKAVRDSLKIGEPSFYVVTGVIHGRKAADGDTTERSAALGFQCQKASVVQPSEAPTNSTRLVVEQVEARSYSPTRGGKPKPTSTEEPVSEIGVGSSGAPDTEMESNWRKSGDPPPSQKPPRRGIRKAVKQFGDRAGNAANVISIMGRRVMAEMSGRA